MSLLRAADLEIFYVQVPVNFLSMHLVTFPSVNEASRARLGSNTCGQLVEVPGA